MNPDWQQPFVFIFEWGMFILGWSIVTVLAFFALAVLFALVKATFVATFVVAKRKSVQPEEKKEEPKKAPYSGGSLDDNPPKI